MRAHMVISFLAWLPLASACLVPDLAQYGYTSCTKDEQCAEAGRVCQSGFCSPPTWWDEKYGARRQLRVKNNASVPLPAGFPLRIPVGPEPRPLKIDELNAIARIIILDRRGSPPSQVEAEVAVDVQGASAFDALLSLPQELAPGATTADLWLYTGAPTGTAARQDKSAQLYTVVDDFEDVILDATLWRTAGAATLQDGEVRIQRGGYLWSPVGIPAVPGGRLIVDFTISSGAACDGFVMGLIGNASQGYLTPYVTLEATGGGNFVVQALRNDTFPIEPDIPALIALPDGAIRLDLQVSGANVQAFVEGTQEETFTMQGPMPESAVLRPHVFVEGGNCDVLVHRLRLRAAVDPEPALTVEAVVHRPD